MGVEGFERDRTWQKVCDLAFILDQVYICIAVVFFKLLSGCCFPYTMDAEEEAAVMLWSYLQLLDMDCKRNINLFVHPINQKRDEWFHC